MKNREEQTSAAGSTTERKRMTIPLEDIVMSAIQVAGIGASAFALMKFTSLPHWLCFVIAVPGFIGLFLGGCFLLARMWKR